LKTRKIWKRGPEYIIEIECREPGIRWGKWGETSGLQKQEDNKPEGIKYSQG
jgi:hypothetical protein